jgi:hypothetical protein
MRPSLIDLFFDTLALTIVTSGTMRTRAAKPTLRHGLRTVHDGQRLLAGVGDAEGRVDPQAVAIEQQRDHQPRLLLRLDYVALMGRVDR